MKRKKLYDKPQMRIVKLSKRMQLLAGSGVSATRDTYGDANEEDWE